ncbi:MAG: histidine ammonia-lyase [Candidatus Dormibacteraeota bacterium]|uniref:Histidine ammonia-lyase n=1 Tax=Candidatus Aeolococcus gillhamiae TaxID=3127015 RepID=A0A934JV50_9BACT|nr:histidine ammonia-lyase [Candidatus Dormibacteraeota bacterium]
MVVLDGSPLTIDDVIAVVRGGATVEVGEEARRRMAPSRAIVEQLDSSDSIAYGVTTGFGALADRAVQPADRAALQRHVVLSHASGMGDALDAEVVRGMLLLRARTLCAGYSGVRPVLPESLVALLNSGLVPWVPEHGSLGASGDLAPLAHATACLLGEGWVWDGATRQPAGEALAGRGLEPLTVGPREGLALINGTDGMSALLALAVADLEALLRAADVIAAMSVEALLGTTRAFAENAVALRPAPGQAASAANLRALLADSALVASHRESHHAVQDPYSLRCTPQVHGAARDVHAFARECVQRELEAVVDNPMVLDGEVVSGGNFHGQALAYAADMLASVCADVAAISERRLDRLLDPARSRGLPAFLTPSPGLNSGLMICQYTAAAMVVELRAAASPIAVHSMSTSAGQEDHVSMGFTAAMRTRRSVTTLRRVLAAELLAAAQALELRAPLRPGSATGAVIASLRARVAHLDDDRVLAGDLEQAEEWLREQRWRGVLPGVTDSLR